MVQQTADTSDKFCSIKNSCHKFNTTEHTLHYYSPLVHTIQTLPCLPIVNNWHMKITGLIYKSDFRILHLLMKPQRNTYFCITSTNETIKKKYILLCIRWSWSLSRNTARNWLPSLHQLFSKEIQVPKLIRWLQALTDFFSFCNPWLPMSLMSSSES